MAIAGCDKRHLDSAPSTPANTGLPSQTTAIAASPSNSPGPSASPASDPAAIIAKATRGLSGLQTYMLERNISSAKWAAADKSDLVTTTVISTAALDLSSRRMKMNNSIFVKLASGDNAGPVIENSIYIMNNTLYVQGLFMDNASAWGKTDLPESAWQSQNQAQQLINLLQVPKMSILQAETVNDSNLVIPCDVIQLTPDLKGLWALVVNQPGIQLPSEAPTGVAYDQIIKASQMKLWVAQSDGMPVKASIQINIQVKPAQVASLTSTVSMDVTISMLFESYNKPVSITLPAEATAPDVPDLNSLKKAQ